MDGVNSKKVSSKEETSKEETSKEEKKKDSTTGASTVTQKSPQKFDFELKSKDTAIDSLGHHNDSKKSSKNKIIVFVIALVIIIIAIGVFIYYKIRKSKHDDKKPKKSETPPGLKKSAQEKQQNLKEKDATNKQESKQSQKVDHDEFANEPKDESEEIEEPEEEINTQNGPENSPQIPNIPPLKNPAQVFVRPPPLPTAINPPKTIKAPTKGPVTSTSANAPQTVATVFSALPTTSTVKPLGGVFSQTTGEEEEEGENNNKPTLHENLKNKPKNSPPAKQKYNENGENGPENNSPQNQQPYNGNGGNGPTNSPQNQQPYNGNGGNGPTNSPQNQQPYNGNGGNGPTNSPQNQQPYNGNGENGPANSPQSQQSYSENGGNVPESQEEERLQYYNNVNKKYSERKYNSSFQEITREEYDAIFNPRGGNMKESMLMFHWNQCSHCIAAMPEYQEAAKYSPMMFYSIEKDEIEKRPANGGVSLAESYGIRSYPYTCYTNKDALGNKVVEFNRERTVDGYSSFANDCHDKYAKN
jgi:hypothetical protein